MNTVKSILLILLPVWLMLISESSHGRHAAIMIDADNGSVLHEVNATHSWYPASLTKVMTLYMAFDALKAGQIHLYDTLRASYHASRQPNSKLGLRPGETLTVQEAILAIITRSANDAAVVLAEHIGGTEESFAVKMTTKAHTLGMYDTHFMNATGLPHQWQVTTSRDMAMLAWKTQRNFPDYYPYFATHSFYFKGRELPGINKFTASYPGAEGMKTGFTCGSGYNLISTASQNGKRLIGVILGGMTSAERYQLMIDMMNDGFANSLNPAPARNITTMTAHVAGLPPYQLGCGNFAPTTVASNDTSDSYVAQPRRAVKSPSIRHINNHRIVKTSKPVIGKKGRIVKTAAVKSHRAGNKKGKIIKAAAVKSRHAGKGLLAARSKTVHIAKPAGKVAAKSKPSKTRYRRS
jgi:D-alanyl-D-alanine carboxypeptidase